MDHHGTRRGPIAGTGRRRRRPPAPTFGRRDRRRPARRPAHRPHVRHPAPGREAEQRADHPLGAGGPDRLRHRQIAGRLRPDADRDGHRIARLHGSRTRPRRLHRPRIRPLVAGRDALLRGGGPPRLRAAIDSRDARRPDDRGLRPAPERGPAAPGPRGDAGEGPHQAHHGRTGLRPAASRRRHSDDDAVPLGGIRKLFRFRPPDRRSLRPGRGVALPGQRPRSQRRPPVRRPPTGPGQHDQRTRPEPNDDPCALTGDRCRADQPAYRNFRI